MKQTIIILLSVVFIAALFYSCKKDENPVEGVTDGIKTITINHFGVDWSQGKVGTTGTHVDNADGETIGWCPNGMGGGYGTGIWYRATSGKLYRISTAEVTSITTLDTTKWDNDICDTPLKNGDLWATQANDGFVVFKVVQVAMDSASIANDPLWSATVQYKFSTTTKF